MPGIAAVWTPGRKFDPSKGLTRALQALDASGCLEATVLVDGECGLGSILQSYLPEDHFPAVSTAAPLSLVADCRLDNRAELVYKLGLHAPGALSDTQLLAAAWSCWGEDCTKHLIGGFAFVVWNAAKRTLFAARDATGESPLFYSQQAEMIVVASQPRAIHALGVPLGFNQRHIAMWAALNTTERHDSFFAEIRRLPPGSSVSFSPGETKVQQYWHPCNVQPVRLRTDAEYADRMRELLDETTGVRLRSRGEASAQLSSGLDSSSVASSAAIQLAARGRGLTAYTSVPQAGFNDTHPNTNIIFDEGPFAAEVAAMYPNIRQIRVSSEGAPLLQIVKRWTDAMDEPIVNGTNAVWIDAMLGLARANGSDVMFQGSMGNGNLSYESLRLLAMLFRGGRWLKLAEAVYRHRVSRFMSIRQAARATFQDFFPARFSRDLREQRAAFSLDYCPLNEEFIREHRVLEQTAERMVSRTPELDEERRNLYERFDLGTLNAASRTLHQVDPRDPTFDRRIWEYTYAIPVQQFIVGGHSRSLIRRAMVGRLPDNTLYRYARGHQGADWYFNMRAALPDIRTELEEQERSPAARAILDLARLKLIADSFPSSDFQRARVFNPYHFALLRGVTLGYFLRRHDPALAGSS